MSVVLGLNEFFHDTAACVVVDGRVAALVEQERLDRRKHAPGFALLGAAPWEAVRWCLDAAGLAARQVDRIAVSFSADLPRGLGMLAGLARGNLRRSHPLDTLRNRRALDDPASRFVGGFTAGLLRRRAFLRELSGLLEAPVEVVDHHRAHAASAWHPSGFDHAAVIVLDGMGDAGPTSLWEGRDGRLRLVDLTDDPDASLGVLYRTVSLALGFRFMDAGKTMGLAAWGEPREPFLGMLRLEGDGYAIDWPLVRRLCHRHRRAAGPLGPEHRDLAASLQRQLEEVGAALARRAMRLTGARRLCLAGGVALNCNMNARILREPGVADVFVQPGAMDQGCALGAALEVAQRSGDAPDRRFSVHTGPRWSDDSVARALEADGIAHVRVEDPAEAAAALLAEGRVVGWFQGAMEFGPRALGARSVLAHPGLRATRDRVNRLKGREPWRPLAPAVLVEALPALFEGGHPSPWMTFTFPFRPEARARFAAVVHEDGSARVQSVTSDENPRFHGLIAAFERRTGLPGVLNTSFNTAGEPIVCSPAQAIAAFRALRLDAVVLGACVVRATGGAA